MRFWWFACVLLLSLAVPLEAAVDMALRGQDPVRLEDVYQQDGRSYVAIEEALDVAGLSGHWNSIDHVFRIRTPRGWAEISPASSFLKLGEDYYPLQDKPRFIDGRLRVSGNFVLNQLAMLAGQPIYFNNLDPQQDRRADDESDGLEKFFAFLLNRQTDDQDAPLRAVAIDPGHGGLDTGVIAASGFKEKTLTLELAEQLAKRLKMRLGIPIYLSRDGDYEASREQRLRNASREDVDLWLLVHAQAAFSPEIQGVSLFIRPEEAPPTVAEAPASIPRDSNSRRLAQTLAEALREADIAVQGIYPTARLSLGQGNLPTVQVEVGYLSHPRELELLRDQAYQDHLVQALFAGIDRYARMSQEQSHVTE